MTNLSDAITQIAVLGDTAVKVVTPSMIEGARILAWYNILTATGICFILWFMVTLIFMYLSKDEIDTDNGRKVVIWISICASVSVVINIVLFFTFCGVDIYGYFHPQGYLAYQALQALTSH